jgi:hypothetical protein
MPPDAGVITAFLDALRKRAFSQHLCEALLAGSVTALVITLVLLRPLPPDRLVWWALAALAAGAIGWMRLRGPARREPALVSLAEARQASLRNLLVTERELARVPDRALPFIRARVQRDAARVIRETSVTDIAPAANLIRPVAGATIVCALTIAVALFGGRSLSMMREGLASGAAAASAASGSAAPAAAVTGTINAITITVIPPSYTGRPAQKLVNPSSVDVLIGSKLALSIDATALVVEREFGGLRQRLARLAPASPPGAAQPSSQTQTQPYADEIVAQETGVLTLTATNGDARQPIELAQRLIAVAVAPDQPPTVRLAKPAKDLLFPDNSASISFQAEATDDFGLQSLTLHYTKVSGSGERYEFNEGEIPVSLTRQDARTWRADLTRTLASLQVNEGDTFVYYAAATDQRPGQARGVSDSYVIEIGQAGAAIAGGFAIPPDEDKAAISLSALIQKTEKLHAQRATMATAAFVEASNGLAIEQRMVRSFFLFSMGTHGHVENEEEEAENSDEIQGGRLQNRGQAELTEATRQMTRAEQALTNADTGPAIVAQKAALAAVQRAQSRQRYFLRTTPVPGQIDPTRRLTGDLSEAKASEWPGAPAVASARADAIRGVLLSLAAIASGLDAPEMQEQTRVVQGQAAASTATAQAQPTQHTSIDAAHARADAARAAAGRVLALGPASPAMRTASDRLQNAARELDGGRPQAARPLIQEAANAILALAREASSPAANAAPAADRGLRGASVDALRRTGGSR